jgi:hypothetical protein
MKIVEEVIYLESVIYPGNRRLAGFCFVLKDQIFVYNTVGK